MIFQGYIDRSSCHLLGYGLSEIRKTLQMVKDDWQVSEANQALHPDSCAWQGILTIPSFTHCPLRLDAAKI
jgi:hypothetical protein